MENPQNSSVVKNVDVYSKKKLKIVGINIPIFFSIVIILLIAIYMGVLPQNMATGIIVSMVLGLSLMWIGDQIPIFNTFGGGPILCILIPALFLYWGIFPESLGTLTDSFYNEIGFSDFAVPGIIVGSILGMDRNMLMKTGVRFFIPLLAAVVSAMLIGGLAGQLLGYGFMNALFFIVGPIIGGGMSAGAVPMAEIFASNDAGNAGDVLARIAPAVVVANMLTILAAGILNGLGNKKNRPKNFSGDGEMLRVEKDNQNSDLNKKGSSFSFSINSLIIGIIITSTAYVFGLIMADLINAFHFYVWIILGAAVLKIFKVLPESIEKASADWFDFITKAWVPAILVSISAGMVDFSTIIDIVTDPSYIGLAILTVVIAVFAAGFVGLLVGFYFVESAIGAGLGMADMGGSGDVAVLSASNRMGLMPFLQISSRIGGAIMLIILSVLASIFM